MNNWII